MAIEFINKADTANPAVNTNAATTSSVVNVPASVIDGDYMLATVYKNIAATNSLTPPAGWTFVDSIELSTTLGIYIYYRWASSEPASYTWTIGGTASSWSVGVNAFRGVDTLNPIDTYTLGTSATTTTANVPAPNVTTSREGCVVVHVRSTHKNTGTPTGVGFSSSDLSKTQEMGLFDSAGVQRRCVTYYTDTSWAVNGATPTSVSGYLVPGTYGSAYNTSASQTTTGSVLGTIALRPAPSTYQAISGARSSTGTTSVDLRGINGTFGSATIGGVNALTVTVPQGSDDGTYMLAHVVTNTDAVTHPAGWTVLYTDNAGTGNAWQSFILGRRASSEPASYSWSLAGTTAAPAYGVISTFKNVDLVEPIHATALTTGTTATAATAPAVTTTVPCAIVSFRGVRVGSATRATFTSDATSGELYDGGNAGTVAYSGTLSWLSLGQTLPAGLQATWVVTASTAPTDSIIRTIALRAQPLAGQNWPYNNAVTRTSRW